MYSLGGTQTIMGAYSRGLGVRGLGFMALW